MKQRLAAAALLSLVASQADGHPGHNIQDHGVVHQLTSPGHAWPWIVGMVMVVLAFACCSVRSNRERRCKSARVVER